MNVEITVDYGLADVVADRFDAGVRLGGDVAKDMIAVRIGPDTPMAIVGSPANLAPASPITSPDDLTGHRAINLQLPTSGVLNGWRMTRGGRETRVRVDGQWVLNTIDLILDAAIDRHGLAKLPLDQVEGLLRDGHLAYVLDKFTPDLPGYHLYYPTAGTLRQHSRWSRPCGIGEDEAADHRRAVNVRFLHGCS